jgi:hypothetical protein
MTQLFLIALLVLALITLVAIFAAKLGWKRAQEAEAALLRAEEALCQIQRTADRLQKTLGEQTKVEAKADVERKNLAGTADSDLVRRANSLFGGGLQDKSAAGNGGNDQA